MTADARTTTRAAPVHGQAPAPIRAVMRTLGRLAPGLAGRLAADLFMRPLRPQPRARERGWISTARPVKLPTRHGLMEGWSWGDGPAVVLVHGWNSRGSQMGFLARTLAEAGFRAIAYDGPAHGRSPGRRTNLINHSAALVDVCAGLPELQGVVGHSFGGLAISYRWSELPPLKRLAMISPPAEMKIYSSQFMKIVDGSDEVHERMLAIYRKRFDIVWNDLTVENMAPGLDVPVLVVHDRADRQAPFGHGRRTVEAWSGARLHETRGLGHNRILRDGGVAAEVAAFMAGTGN